MRRYCIEIDEPLSEQLESIARDIAKLNPEELIVLLIAKQLAPWHRAAKANDGAINEQ